MQNLVVGGGGSLFPVCNTPTKRHHQQCEAKTSLFLYVTYPHEVMQRKLGWVVLE